VHDARILVLVLRGNRPTPGREAYPSSYQSSRLERGGGESSAGRDVEITSHVAGKSFVGGKGGNAERASDRRTTQNLSPGRIRRERTAKREKK